MKKQIFFLTVCVIGTLLTTYYLVEFIKWDAGEFTAMNALKFNWINFFKAGFVNPGAAFITVDVIVGVICFSSLVIWDSKKYGIKRPWLYILMVFVIGYAFAFPFYMFMRAKNLENKEKG